MAATSSAAVTSSHRTVRAPRGEQIISQHSKVIGKFVDTHESKFGQIALKSLFEAADKDGNGVLDKEVSVTLAACSAPSPPQL